MAIHAQIIRFVYNKYDFINTLAKIEPKSVFGN